MKYPKIPIIFLAAAMSTSTLVVAEDDEEELQFEEAYLFFELNDTDGDLGIHGKVDGGPWKWVAIENPNERRVMKVATRGGIRRQGLTELFFESAEPTFDELDPEKFFQRFPEGVYEWEGMTLDWEEIEGEVHLSHIIPAAPVVTGVSGEDENPGFEIEVNDEDEEEVVKACWGVDPDANGDVVITWDAVTTSHKDMWDVDVQPLLPGEELRYGGDDQPERKIPLGSSGALDGIVYYEFVAEIDDTDYKSTAQVPAGTTSWTVPAEFIALTEEGEIKFEILVRVETGEGEDDDGDPVDSRPGNKSAVEDCFEIG